MVTSHSGETPELDWGEHRITTTLKNVGASPLHVVQVVPSCSCTAASVSPKEILPGEEAVLDCKWNTVGLSGPQITDVALVCRTADGAGTTMSRVILDADIVPAARFFPPSLSFTPDSGDARTVEMSVHGDPSLTIHDIEATHPALKVQINSNRRSFAVLLSRDQWADAARSEFVHIVLKGRTEYRIRYQIAVFPVDDARSGERTVEETVSGSNSMSLRRSQR